MAENNQHKWENCSVDHSDPIHNKLVVPKQEFTTFCDLLIPSVLVVLNGVGFSG